MCAYQALFIVYRWSCSLTFWKNKFATRSIKSSASDQKDALWEQFLCNLCKYNYSSDK